MTKYFIPVYVTRADGQIAQFFLPEEDFWNSVAKMYPESYDLIKESRVAVGGLRPWNIWFTTNEDHDLALWLDKEADE